MNMPRWPEPARWPRRASRRARSEERGFAPSSDAAGAAIDGARQRSRHSGIGTESSWLGHRSSRLILVALLLVTPPVAGLQPAEPETQEAPGPMARFLQDAKWSLQLGYRLEAVDDAAFAKDALASTLRTVLTLDTAGHRASDANGFGVLLQVEDTSVLGNDRSFANAGSGSSANGVDDRPVVADPEQTSLLQARLEHRSVAGAFSLGRMALTHGDQRFLGPVGWRQHHQTFDAARWLSPTWKWGPTSWQLDAAHLDRVHRITTAREPMSIAGAGTSRTPRRW